MYSQSLRAFNRLEAEETYRSGVLAAYSSFIVSSMLMVAFALRYGFAQDEITLDVLPAWIRHPCADGPPPFTRSIAFVTFAARARLSAWRSASLLSQCTAEGKAADILVPGLAERAVRSAPSSLLTRTSTTLWLKDCDSGDPRTPQISSCCSSSVSSPYSSYSWNTSFTRVWMMAADGGSAPAAQSEATKDAMWAGITLWLISVTDQHRVNLSITPDAE
ncbi:hypothetical protein C8Q74DRAFT_678042 [Fomes fomentarius]|nr:hypothetical protein C8Q74DRAFT_678042 [Fomes fomentarius]